MLNPKEALSHQIKQKPGSHFIWSESSNKSPEVSEGHISDPGREYILSDWSPAENNPHDTVKKLSFRLRTWQLSRNKQLAG